MGASSELPGMETQEQAQNVTSERIYIGGYRPPVLTTGDVLQRLQASLGDALDILHTSNKLHDDDDDDDDDDNDNARFMHIDVRCKNTDEGPSAFEQISKMYHNVTWKGCRLRVEAARPHFLQRLQEEIRERTQQRQQQSATEVQQEATTSQSRPPPPRRHWKIRQRYGEQAFKVDTKPHDVDSWFGFEKLVHKTKKRRLQYEEKQQKHNPRPKTGDNDEEPVVDIRSQHRFNRAVHLRFKDSDNLQDTNKFELSNGVKADRVENNESSSDDEIDDDGDSSQSSSSSSSVDSELDQRPPQKKSSYAWSSESSSAEDENDSQNEGDEQSESDGSHQEKFNKFQVVKTTDEFDSGLYHEEQQQRPGESSEDESNQSYSTKQSYNEEDQQGEDAGNLLGDVETNLSVLSSLFPDLKPTKPRLTATTDNGASGGEAKASSSSGWGAGGVMLRYDPTKDDALNLSEKPGNQQAASDDKSNAGYAEEKAIQVGDTKLGFQGDDDDDVISEESSDSSAKKNAAVVIDDAKKNTVNGSDDSGGGSSSSGHDHSEDGDKDQEQIKTNQPSELAKDEANNRANAQLGDIYKQDKLEDVFRESREALALGQTSQATPSATELDNKNSAGGFSFSFSLGPSVPNNPQPPASTSSTDIAGAFSFSFFKDQEEGKNAMDENDNKTKTTESTIVHDATVAGANDDNGVQRPSVPQGFRRRGLFFSKEVLDKYQEDFYVSNDGLKILQDLGRYRNDPEVKEHWKQERYSLTQDWKRKKKQAQQSRKPKQKFSKHH